MNESCKSLSAVVIKRFAFAVLMSVSAALSQPSAEAQVTSNVYQRVLRVRVNADTNHEATATAFTIDVDGREYLITAKHVVKQLRDEDKIDILTNDGWSSLIVKIFRCDDPIDIAVLVPPHQLTINFELSFDKGQFFFGQDAYFLGFPYGIQNAAVNGANGPYPLAIIKKGIISGSITENANKKAVVVLLDGYNNPGFSGGPIVYRDLNQSGVVMNVVGVVSGFMPEVVPVMTKHEIPSRDAAGEAAKAQPWKIVKRENGTFFEYVDTPTYVALNTGIVTGYKIAPAIDLIRQHPIGPESMDLPGNQPKN
jgi:hypothetical protein